MNKYVIGIDGGSTKSHLALFNTDGTLKDFQHWGPLNHEVMPGSFDQFEKELGQFLLNVLRKNNITCEHIAYTVVGMAGVDTREQHKIITAIITRLGLKDFTLCNDAYLGISAGTHTGVGICAINGSGCTIAGINSKGKMLQIGGMGVITGDMGGGSMLADIAIGAVYSALFRMGTPTLLTLLLFEKLGVKDKYELMEKLFKLESEGFSIPSCNSLVFEAASRGDGVAIGILRDMSINYANSVTCMINELEFKRTEALNIVLAGSVFVKAESPLAFDMLKNQLSSAHPEYNITYTVLDMPPVAGAAIWALNTLDEKNNYYTAVRESFKAILDQK